MLKFCFLIFLLGSALARRVSDEKCEEYQNMLKKVQCTGLSLTNKCPNKIISYECDGVGHTGLIVGGVKAKPGEFPHMAAIGYPEADGSVAFKCGGSLISDRYVLTAAHCFYDSGSEPTVVRLGAQNLARPGPKAVDKTIKRFIKHPLYNSINQINDIALIELEETVAFDNKTLRPACLQQREFFGSNVTATGWGKTGTYRQTTDSLMKVNLPFVSVEKCKSMTEKEMDGRKQVCAGGVRKKDTCQGDSGAPIQVSHAENAPCVYDIIGFTSYGSYVCGAAKQYSVYTKTSHYLDWIEGIVWPVKRPNIWVWG